ncbi:MAG: transcription antitermination factor NusB [Legionella sp.]|nr:transcription antitermination factor NusB [Legionella sp.]
MDKQSIDGKRRARKLALQAMYQWHMSGAELTDIEAQFRSNNNMDRVDGDYFCRILYGIPKQLTSLESSFSPYLDRDLSDLNPIELSVLRIGAFELLYCPEVPFKVVLNESIVLTREFGSQDGHKYVNGVLNKVARNVRTYEIDVGNE